LLRLVRKYLKSCLILALFGVLFFCFYQNVKADEPSWFSAENPVLAKESDIDIDVLPPTYNGNRDCTNRTVVTRPSIPLVQSKIEYSGCFMSSGHGIVDPNGYMQLGSTQIAATSTNYAGYRPGVIAIPNTTKAIHLSTSPSTGVYFHITNDFATKLSASVNGYKEVTLTFNQPADTTLKDSDNNLLAVHTDSLAFSKNGKWMIVDAPNKAMLRINVETMEVLPFAPAFNYTPGPGAQTAISNDGRYAVISSRDYGIFKIYDLSTCGAAPSTINGPVSCQSRDLLPIAQSQIPGFIATAIMRFRSDNTIVMYPAYNDGSGVKRARYSFAPFGYQTNHADYLALGDSFASGEGAWDYQVGTNTNINKCHLSNKSYPYLISQDLQYLTGYSIACSGAVMDDVENTTNEYKGQSNDGIPRKDRTQDDINSLLSNLSPGYIAQQEFISAYTPNIVTISISGNDIGFGNKLRACLGPDTCFNSYEDRVEIAKEVHSKFDSLVDLYKKIKEESASNSKVYAIGYTQIVHPGGNCALNVNLNQEELVFAQHITDYLNDMIERASLKAGITYVDVSDALSGHKLCETSSSNVAVNGLTLGDDMPNILGFSILGKESYHPNALGHQMLKNKILEVTNNFALNNQAPNTAIIDPEVDSSHALLDAPQESRAIKTLKYLDRIGPNGMIKQEINEILVDGITNSLKRSSPFSFVLNSEPVDLGTHYSDGLGNIDADITVPDSVSPGFHTLHIYGQDITGTEIDMYKTIYVAQSNEDFDGDGVNNEQDKCTFIESSGIDVDKDGKDDACDDYIADPPRTCVRKKRRRVCTYNY
jgi:lysophospholipase L1-like esterase